MRSSIGVYTFPIFLLLSAATAEAQPFVVDLAQHDAGKVDRVSVGAGMPGAVEVINMMPTKKYSVTTVIRLVPIDPLVNPFAGQGGDEPNFCTDTAKAVEAWLRPATSEKQVETKIGELPAKADACGTERERVLAIVDTQVRRLTTRIVQTATLAPGEELEVKVTRDDNQVWTVIFSTGGRGTWHTLYGFTFTNNQDETYFTKPEGDKHRVTKQFNAEDELTFTPSIFWSWMPRNREASPVWGGLTAGLGFDKTNPAVFLGVIGTYNHNLGVVLGVVAQRQKRLVGAYDPENLPLVAEALTTEQLNREVYRPNLFFGVVFRFGSNPFTQPEDKKAEPKKEEPKKEEAKKEEGKKP